ncbi:UDP glucuronosyltransferase 5 family, polypeptide G1 isoform X1 [Acanthochromis polyacanthus]|uniref:UDP glucuronosyltransferase 5 family, polypeptide G1 isoform X1 n=1 Tax=Acanthochromis polyacanthus TaxID=80966 RepID=UPI0022347968|nr:UDP glucuronosyltransferase 5 family, polypeptide G1 isoform X1 [Acanthochromis polyacanthus]XP_051799942.1 UDP glucuronosyltransferase 5 family, polypeptide G1 isoform X1 [Acanthochromis polyacanthus]
MSAISSFISISLTVLCLLVLSLTICSGSKILVVPVDGSHWINMEVILQELHSRGHDITVLRSAKSWYIPSNSSIYTSIDVLMLEDETDITYYNKMLLDVIECRKYPTFISTFCQQHLITSLLDKGHDVLARAAASMLDDPVFMKKLQDAKFDLMLTDPALTIGVLLGQYLKLPMVFNVRWINSGEGHLTIAPSPVSYVPVSGSELHDQMDFKERVMNMLHFLRSVVEQYFIINPPYSDLLQRHFPPGTDLVSLQHGADIWLLRADFVFEFPRPTMPNVVYIGGFQCKEAKPLPADLEAFMQSSGEHGVVVMSLGTIVSALSREVTEAIAAAFAQLPQKVIWRFVGEKPSFVGNNTLLVKWLPQKDLLGHPKTRAFVAHGGTNGMYEAIYHGVPVVGLPLLFDQFDNLLRLKVRGAARVVEARSLTKESFLEALTDVIETPSYRENIRRLSKLHRDKPMSPMDTAIFWIEYVIRNKGAAHLKSAGSNLPWYSYFCLDVAAFIVAMTGTFIWAIFFTCRILCCRRSRRKTKAE